MLSIAVCDDEILECISMTEKIKRILTELKVPHFIQEFNSGSGLIQAEGRFDLIFLDILMQKPDGMETAGILREKMPGSILIFITSSREYVFDAYEVEAFRYLVKPVEERKLQKVLESAVQKVMRNSRTNPRESMIVSSRGQKRKLCLEDILYFEIMDRVITAHTCSTAHTFSGESETITFYEKIGILEERLRGKDFFRTHKSYLVNLRHVEAYNRQEIFLDTGESVLLAKRRYEEFGKELLRLMKSER